MLEKCEIRIGVLLPLVPPSSGVISLIFLLKRRLCIHPSLHPSIHVSTALPIIIHTPPFTEKESSSSSHLLDRIDV